MLKIKETTDLLLAAQAELSVVSAELSRITGLGAPELHSAHPHAQDSPLFLYGILGGKDVGKTTLINALAEATISHEERGIGSGTQVPVVYAHHDDVPAVRERLERDPAVQFLLATHDRDLLRQVVLVDLPDFDSKRNLPDHAERAAAFKPHLDAFIWVTTVRKMDHPELLRQMNSVAPKQENFLCVVTFADEVIESAKDSMEGLRGVCLDKLHRLYFADFDPENLFVICTLDRGKYDFPALSHRLVRQHSAEEIGRRVRRNAVRSTLANADRLRDHYRVDASREALTRLLEELPTHYAKNLPEEYWESVTDRVSRLDGPYRRMASRLFTHRIWGWPILSALLFPLSAVISYLGGRLFFETGGRWTDYHELKEILTVDGLGLDVRLRRIASEMKAKFLRLHQEFNDQLIVEIDSGQELIQWGEWLDGDDRQTLERLQERYSRPAFWKRWLVYLPLFWFPLAQPVLESYLRDPELTSGQFVRGLALTFVSLLSASYLLQSVTVLLIVYTLWLLWFYASSARQVAQRRLAGFTALRQSRLEPSLLDQLRAPYEHLADTLQRLSDRLEHAGELLEEALESGG